MILLAQLPSPVISPSSSEKEVRRQREGGVPEMPSEHSLFPIVGIGASAGGLEAFKEVLRFIPDNTGMAYVLVQHLDPRHESLLSTLLARTTPMEVHEAREGMKVCVNHVYVIARNTDMTLSQGMLQLVPRTEAGGQHLSIDTFLRSLAEC